LIIPFVALALLSGCASTASKESDDQAASEDWSESDAWAETESDDGFYGEDYDEGENDPLEIPNRFIFAFNEALDVLILQPAAATYRFLVPSPVRDSVQSFMRNLRTPIILVNDLLQGKPDRAGDTAMRFLINSTVGVLGFIDVAEGMGYPYHSEDFGQTLGSYGVGEGFYLVLPLFGPSSLRDGTGRLVDQLFDPLTYVGYYFDDDPGVTEALIGRSALEGVDFRARNIETVEDIKRDALDVYARFRSLYRQFRQNEIEDGGANPDDSGGGFSGLEGAPLEALAAE
jgi:phospholipid-binding lipoprotein MlaA